MNVDTGEFRALTDEVAALSRKVSRLTGAITVMGKALDAEGGPVELAHVFRLGLELGERTARPLAPPAPPPRPERHLRAIDGGQR